MQNRAVQHLEILHADASEALANGSSALVSSKDALAGRDDGILRGFDKK